MKQVKKDKPIKTKMKKIANNMKVNDEKTNTTKKNKQTQLR